MLGRSNNESEEDTFRRAWDILNYIKSITNWNTLTRDELCFRLMSAADTRYRLRGDSADKYGPNGYLALRAVGRRLHRATLTQVATEQLTQQRNIRGRSAEEHIRAVVNVPLQHQHQLLNEAGNIQQNVNDNTITGLLRFFGAVFNMDALKNDVLDPNGTAQTYENIARRMLPSLGGPTAGVDIQQEFNIYPLPEGCDLSNDVFFWKFTRGDHHTNHIDTIKFQNVKSLMFYNAMACFKGRNCVPWDKKNVHELIMEILGEEGRIWYITKDGYVHTANEMGSYDMIEIPRGRILAECCGSGTGGHSLIRAFVSNL